MSHASHVNVKFVIEKLL